MPNATQTASERLSAPQPAAGSQPAWTLTGCIIDSGTRCSLELDSGDCDVALIDCEVVWHDGEVDNLYVEAVTPFCGDALPVAAARAWVAANLEAVEDRIHEAYEADAGWVCQ